MPYYNPAAAIGVCKRKGLETPGELYECAVGRAPVGAPNSWFHEARRLSAAGALGRAGRRRRKKSRR